MALKNTSYSLLIALFSIDYRIKRRKFFKEKSKRNYTLITRNQAFIFEKSKFFFHYSQKQAHLAQKFGYFTLAKRVMF